MYSIELSDRFKEEFRKLDKYTQRMLRSWINKNLDGCSDPRQHGKALVGNLKGLWRYRIGDYRLICLIEDNRLIITAMRVEHRSSVYK